MYRGKLILGILTIILFSYSSAFAQKTKAQLQKEKQENLKKIKEVENILSQTSTKKKNSLGELNALNARIKAQEKLMGGIKGEIGLLDTEIKENRDIIDALEEDLKKLKKEYADMLYKAQKSKNSVSPLSFIFSAESLDQLLTRLRYMEQYTKARELQVEEISKVQEELSGQVTIIQSRRDEKSKLLEEQISESTNLTELKTKQNQLVNALLREEKVLKSDLEKTRRQIAELDFKINEIIKTEIAKEVRTKETVALSSSFQDNKAKFPWPVSGFVSQKFGRQFHPVLKGVEINNEGVNIQTKEDEKVKSIFEGEVRAVAVMPNFGNSVIISHGEYFSVYSGLKEVSVRTGQKVGTNQEIGEVLTNGEGVSELKFRIYKNKTALDPQQWLSN